MSERPQPDTPEAWLQRARSDLAVGRAALGVRDAMAEDACFHAQQCSEKALKALLIHRREIFPRTHVLEHLLLLLEETGVAVPADVQEAVSLTQYAVEVRYPGVWQPVTAEEAREGLHIAERVLRWVESKM